jgi:hypothetical protein
MRLSTKIYLCIYFKAERSPRKLATAISVTCNMCSTQADISSRKIQSFCIIHHRQKSKDSDDGVLCIIVRIAGFSENSYQPELNTCYTLWKLRLGLRLPVFLVCLRPKFLRPTQVPITCSISTNSWFTKLQDVNKKFRIVSVFHNETKLRSSTMQLANGRCVTEEK